MCILENGENQEQARSEFFCGSIKSFNTRRGFGFVTCEETALRFGRDVYLSKDEAMVLAAEPAVGQAAADAAGNDEKKVPPVQEGDILMFQVKLSTEGFPQAVDVRKIRRLRGVVQQAPSSTSDGIIIVNGDGSKGEEALYNQDAALQQLLGAAVRLRQAECGQLQLVPNDEVAFCCVSTSENNGQALEAQLVELLCTSRIAGSILGYFSLKMPLLKWLEDGLAAEVPMVKLHGHALTNCVYLANVPSDVSSPDLMRLFGKLGGKEATVTYAGGGHASISFDTSEDIAKFLVHATHTISENSITQLAHVGPCAESDAILCSTQPATSTSTSSPAQTLNTCQPQPQSLTLEAQIPMASSNAALLQANQTSQLQTSVNYACSVPQSLDVQMMASMPTLPSWRCMHSNIVVPPAEPQMLLAAENCCNVCIQWPTVIHASAYVVELYDQGTMTAQRFMRCPELGSALPPLMDLRIEGLQPSSYAACVRCVAPCGCESSVSQWSFVTAGQVMPSGYVLPPNAPAGVPGLIPQSCPPPPSAPPSFPVAAPFATASLPAIPEETFDPTGNGHEEILCLD